ncbi:MAG TPA: hypothetical protein VFV20_05350, partial [Candidatus Limnocylindria bacterium]|nr:hypothetical protein [Candidatus Limnocylindria bacterium]
MLHFVERKWMYFLLSGLLIVPGVVFLLLGGLRPGIEFKGGTLLDATFPGATPAVSDVREVMSTLGRGEAVVQAAEGGRIEIRTFEMSPEDVTKATKALQDKFGAG